MARKRQVKCEGTGELIQIEMEEFLANKARCPRCGRDVAVRPEYAKQREQGSAKMLATIAEHRRTL